MILVTRNIDTPLIMDGLLSTMSMLSSTELVMSCDMPDDCIAGFTGEEKEGIGSMPFSSLTPVSLSSTPVRLDIGYEHWCEESVGKDLLLLTFLYGQALCSLQAPSLFAVSFLEPWLDNTVRPAHSSNGKGLEMGIRSYGRLL